MGNKKRMLLQQVFWGGLTAVSLLVMFVVVKLAVGGESGQPAGNHRPYTAATDSFLAGFNGITRLAKVPDQRTLELGNGILKPDHNED
ncbi:MAG: hypothetical protein K2N63_10295, partial [Lachnospiraceae bacterium]|nr:hypothetical protein [Lachnospiraceae bacterium]